MYTIVKLQLGGPTQGKNDTYNQKRKQMNGGTFASRISRCKFDQPTSSSSPLLDRLIDHPKGEGMSSKVVSRSELVVEYQQLAEALREAVALQEANPDDEDTLAIAEEIRQQLCPKAAALNNSETVVVTGGVQSVVGADPGGGPPRKVCLYPAAAPYQVLYDNSAWYSCVVLSSISPPSAIDRIKYKVWILGYNVTEVVFSEQLRPWRRQEEPVASNLACHAIHASGWFKPCIVDRVTPHNTVFVTFADTPAGDSSSPVAEVPLSHVRLGKFYRELKKKVIATEDELKQRKIEAAARKRERDGQKRQQQADVCAQNSTGWKDLLKDVTGLL